MIEIKLKDNKPNIKIHKDASFSISEAAYMVYLLHTGAYANILLANLRKSVDEDTMTKIHQIYQGLLYQNEVNIQMQKNKSEVELAKVPIIKAHQIIKMSGNS